MAANSKIEWTDATWNPVAGCTRESPGCDNCYAVRQSYRLEGMGSEKYTGLTVLNDAGDRHFNGVVRTVPVVLAVPLRWQNPRRIFVNSMSDLFHASVPEEFIHDVLLVCGACHWHTFQVLTKRPQRAATVLSHLNDDDARNYAFCRAFKRVAKLIDERDMTWLADYAREQYWPPRNIWLGTSCEDQRTANKRIPHIRRCPAVVRFLSLEPLLGPIKLDTLDGIHWVIVGGESGPVARPADVEWIRSIIARCKAAGVACFVKQLGSRPFDSSRGDSVPGPKRFNSEDLKHPEKAEFIAHLLGKTIDAMLLKLRDRSGSDMSEWPQDVRVREFPISEVKS